MQFIVQVSDTLQHNAAYSQKSDLKTIEEFRDNL